MKAALAVSVVLPTVIALSGCAPEAYRHDADREVSRILKERKQEALGYQPESSVSDEPAPQAIAKDYRKIPATAIPPAMPPAVATPTVDALPYGPLGPDRDVVPL